VLAFDWLTQAQSHYRRMEALKRFTALQIVQGLLSVVAAISVPRGIASADLDQMFA
jgi:hypothetical protein